MDPVMRELDRVVAETEATLPEVKEWFITKDSDDEQHTNCPHCGAVDEIYEMDRAIRWNSLHQTSGGWIAYTGDYEFEGCGWVCGTCSSDDLTAPADFEIKDYG